MQIHRDSIIQELTISFSIEYGLFVHFVFVLVNCVSRATGNHSHTRFFIVLSNFECL